MRMKVDVKKDDIQVDVEGAHASIRANGPGKRIAIS